MIEGSFQSDGRDRWEQPNRGLSSAIVAQPGELQAADAPAAGSWLERIRKRPNHKRPISIRSQLAVVLTILIVGFLYLPRRFTAQVVPPGLRPAPVPVPVPAVSIALPLVDSKGQVSLLVSEVGLTRVAQFIPAPLSQAPDYPAFEQAPRAPLIYQNGDAAGAITGIGPSVALSPVSGAATSPAGPTQIDPIYMQYPELFPSSEIEGAALLEPYIDALNPTMLDEFSSRPSMSGVDVLQPTNLSTPVPFSRRVSQFASRPPMGGLIVLREEIDRARSSLSVQVDAGATVGLGPPASGGPGSLWPTFEPPNPISQEHYWLESPIPGGFNQYYSPGYQFGSTGGGRYRIHHGVDIGNVIDTPVLASASGEVIHAGPDNPALLGPYNDFYGNAVVIHLDRKLNSPYGEQDVYLLYGHLASVEVQEGQWVGAGENIGGVGMTGIAIGPHLHLEVRLGQNSYLHTVNPTLWMRPFANTGIVAVRLLSANGRTWPNVHLSLFRYAEDGVHWYRVIETYPEQESIGPDPSWGENGALSNIPVGTYRILAYVGGEEVSQEITVRDGETTFVELRTQQ